MTRCIDCKYLIDCGGYKFCSKSQPPRRRPPQSLTKLRQCMSYVKGEEKNEQTK